MQVEFIQLDCDQPDTPINTWPGQTTNKQTKNNKPEHIGNDVKGAASFLVFSEPCGWLWTETSHGQVPLSPQHYDFLKGLSDAGISIQGWTKIGLWVRTT